MDEPRRIRPGPPRLDDFDYHRTDVVYFVTICAATGTPFADPALATIVVSALEWLRTERGVRLYASA